MDFDIKIQGLDSLLDRIDDLADKQELTNAVEKSCEIIKNSAKKKAPKDTGALRRSITYEVESSSSEIVGTVFTPLEYAPYVEYGTGLFAENGNGRKDVPWLYKDDKGKTHITSGQHPQPYMRPALEENKDKVIKRIKGALK